MPPRNQPRALPADLPPRPERGGPYYTGGAEPVLLAERARAATVPGRCILCDAAITPGQRIARLPSGGAGGFVHVACAARTPGVAR